MKLIEALQKVEYHDSILQSLKFDFNDNRVEMILNESSDKPSVTLVFEDVTNLSFEGLMEFDDVEVYSADFLKNEENNYKAKFTFLLGFGKPSSELKFLFKKANMSYI